MIIEAPKDILVKDIQTWIDTQTNALKGLIDTSFVTLTVPSNKVAREFAEAVDSFPKKRFVEICVRPTNTITLGIPE